MHEWKTKRDLPIFWGLILLLLITHTYLKNSTLIIYFLGTDTTGKIISYNEKYYIYEYKYNKSIFRVQVKQRSNNKVEDLVLVPVRVQEDWGAILMNDRGLKSVRISILIPTVFLLLPIIITLLIIFQKLRGDPI